MFKKKSLGQNFLTSAQYLQLIADSAKIAPGEHVLEAGPGMGALTQALLARGARVVAVEKDARLIPLLKEKFSLEITSGALKLIEGDVLEISVEDLIEGTYKVVANIPYYITGAFLKKILSERLQPVSLVLLVQKEVAERIARAKKESILSLSVKAYGTAAYVKTVPAGAFSPAPSVASAILKISDVSRKNFAGAGQEKRFFEIVRAGFAQKRKLLRRNLEAVLGGRAAAALEHAGIGADARAEDVALEQWLSLSRF